MPLPIRATEQAAAVLEALGADPDEAERLVVRAALLARLALIAQDPGDPRVRGIVRAVKPTGVLARVATVYVPEAKETWALVWTLGTTEDGGDALDLRHLERIEDT